VEKFFSNLDYLREEELDYNRIYSAYEYERKEGDPN